MNSKLISSFFLSFMLALIATITGTGVNAESQQTRATFGECVQEPVTPTAPSQFFPMPNPSPQIVPTDTLPGGNRPGGPGWFPPTGGGSDEPADETEVRIFSKQSLKGLAKDLRRTFDKKIPFETFVFVEESKEGGSVFKKESAVLFKKGRYDVAEKELPAILIKDASGKHVFAVSNYPLSKEQIIKDVEKALGVKATQD